MTVCFFFQVWNRIADKAFPPENFILFCVFKYKKSDNTNYKNKSTSEIFFEMLEPNRKRTKLNCINFSRVRHISKNISQMKERPCSLHQTNSRHRLRTYAPPTPLRSVSLTLVSSELRLSVLYAGIVAYAKLPYHKKVIEGL